MADTDQVTLRHPETGGEFTTTRRSFEDAYKELGWELVNTDEPAKSTGRTAPTDQAPKG